MLIKYGVTDNNIDVTDICSKKLKYDNYIIIPAGDNERAKIFKDPVYGKIKSIFIYDNDNNVTEYDLSHQIYIDTTSNKVYSDNVPHDVRVLNPDERIRVLHDKLKLDYGSFNDEFPEQKMALRYITPESKVLEIGGNIGRNSLIIGSILAPKSENLVVCESHPIIARQLESNRNLNNMQFKIENSAISKRMLIQRGWDTIQSDEVLEGYQPINIIPYQDLRAKYNIDFNTLVLDCEGAFYFILQDMPEILDNIQLIIMENDYKDINHKNYIDDVLRSKGFQVDYQEAGGWGPCHDRFFEVWVNKS
jgi:FkbM family methyltransferase